MGPETMERVLGRSRESTQRGSARVPTRFRCPGLQVEAELQKGLRLRNGNGNMVLMLS